MFPHNKPLEFMVPRFDGCKAAQIMLTNRSTQFRVREGDQVMAQIEIYSGPQCSYCHKAKELLKSKGLPYTEIDISDEANRTELAGRLPRVRSIPQIFIEGEHVGGYEDLCIWNEAGRLDALVQ